MFERPRASPQLEDATPCSALWPSRRGRWPCARSLVKLSLSRAARTVFAQRGSRYKITWPPGDSVGPMPGESPDKGNGRAQARHPPPSVHSSRRSGWGGGRRTLLLYRVSCLATAPRYSRVGQDRGSRLTSQDLRQLIHLAARPSPPEVPGSSGRRSSESSTQCQEPCCRLAPKWLVHINKARGIEGPEPVVLPEERNVRLVDEVVLELGRTAFARSRYADQPDQHTPQSRCRSSGRRSSGRRSSTSTPALT